MRTFWTYIIDAGALGGLGLTLVVIGERIKRWAQLRLAFRRFKAQLHAQEAEQRLLADALRDENPQRGQ